MEEKSVEVSSFKEREQNFDKVKKIIEGLLFYSGKSLRPSEIKKILFPEISLSEKEIEKVLEELLEEYSHRGIVIKRVSKGYRVEISQEVLPFIKKINLKEKPYRWTKNLIETLAVIAYFQPITRAEISLKRGGVDSSSAIKTLLERGFIKVVGRKKVPGSPPLYGTTDFFLEYFGLNSLEELPSLDELKKIV